MTTKTIGRGELVKALVQFQGSCPPVAYDKIGQVGARTYGYASLAAILSAIRAPLASAGLAVTQTFDNGCLVTTLHHAAGGSIESRMPLT